MIELKEKIGISISIPDRPDFDEACKRAHSHSVTFLGITDDGHSDYVKGWKRSEHCIRVKFVSMYMVGGITGWEYLYEFKCWAE